jgi:hypothetical protein
MCRIATPIISGRPWCPSDDQSCPTAAGGSLFLNMRAISMPLKFMGFYQPAALMLIHPDLPNAGNFQ